MASPQEHAPLSTQPSPQETSSPRARPPRRPGMGSNGGERGDVGVRCVALCFHLPSRSKKKPPPPVKFVPACKSAEELDASASQRVTFLASASLSTWWPSSPSAAAGAPGNDVAGRRMSAAATTSSSRRSGGGRRALSSSFSYWRRSTQSSSRVMPHGGAAPARVSFSFPSSPVSVSSCMSTPKISHGCQE